MTKAELIDAIANDTGLSKKDTEAFLKAFTSNVSKVLENGDSLSLVGFGTFSVGERGERTGRNPKTGETMTIKASKSPKFKAGKTLKDLVNKN